MTKARMIELLENSYTNKGLLNIHMENFARNDIDALANAVMCIENDARNGIVAWDTWETIKEAYMEWC